LRVDEMKSGPQPISPEQRRRTLQVIAQALQSHYQDQLIALGVYGSLARGTDGPFSDIEMHCVVQGEEIEYVYEWSTGPWKAEVDVYSPEVILAQTREVEGDWSITHGAFVRVLPVFDPQDFFLHLKETALSQPEEVFRHRIKEVIVGDLYELVGKVRNAWAAQNTACLPEYAVQLAKGTACLVGLAQRHLYHGSGNLYQEALTLPDTPQGFAALCRRVMSGKLYSPKAIVREVNGLWEGIEAWAWRRSIVLEDQLDELLDKERK
jgi:kanamycin nucleotidyltransferase